MNYPKHKSSNDTTPKELGNWATFGCTTGVLVASLLWGGNISSASEDATTPVVGEPSKVTGGIKHFLWASTMAAELPQNTSVAESIIFPESDIEVQEKPHDHLSDMPDLSKVAPGDGAMMLRIRDALLISTQPGDPNRITYSSIILDYMHSPDYTPEDFRDIVIDLGQEITYTNTKTGLLDIDLLIKRLAEKSINLKNKHDRSKAMTLNQANIQE